MESIARQVAASLLESGLPIRMRVRGWSMKPMVNPGSLVSIAPVSRPLRKGDVVLFRSVSGQLIAHRVAAHRDDVVWTKGDACHAFDEPIHFAQILGHVVRVESPYLLPLTGGVARKLGLLVARIYPRLVRLRSVASRYLRSQREDSTR